MRYASSSVKVLLDEKLPQRAYLVHPTEHNHKAFYETKCHYPLSFVDIAGDYLILQFSLLALMLSDDPTDSFQFHGRGVHGLQVVLLGQLLGNLDVVDQRLKILCLGVGDVHGDVSTVAIPLEVYANLMKCIYVSKEILRTSSMLLRKTVPWGKAASNMISLLATEVTVT